MDERERPVDATRFAPPSNHMTAADPFIAHCSKLIHQEQYDGVLWHYTTVDALLKIVESGSIHLNCYSFMNDPSEGERSPAFLGRCWHAAFDQLHSHSQLDLNYLRGAVDRLPKLMRRKDHDTLDFVFGASTVKDSLSQWARYGGDGTGVALGLKINATAFPPLPKPGWSYGAFLHEIIYDAGDGDDPLEGAAGRLATKLAELVVDFIPKIRHPVDAENAVFVVADILRPLLKHGAYREEAEWRISARTNKTSTALYDLKAHRLGLVPFMKLPLGEGVKLVEVMVGPKLPPDNDWSVQWLLHKHGVDAQVSRSKLAYR
jgi:hypothetical protein